MELDPNNDQLKQEFLYAATKSGMDGERRIEIIQAHPIAGKPKDDFILEYAKAYGAAGRYDEAEKIMLGHEFVPAEGGERAITGLYYAIRLRKGRKALRDGRAEEALEIFSALHERLPENLHAGNWTATELVPVYYYEAVALGCLGRVEESRTLYQRIADRLSPGLLDLAFYFGSALRALGREIDARIYLSRVRRELEKRASLRSVGIVHVIQFAARTLDQSHLNSSHISLSPLYAVRAPASLWACAFCPSTP